MSCLSIQQMSSLRPRQMSCLTKLPLVFFYMYWGTLSCGPSSLHTFVKRLVPRASALLPLYAHSRRYCLAPILHPLVQRTCTTTGYTTNLSDFTVLSCLVPVMSGNGCRVCLDLPRSVASGATHWSALGWVSFWRSMISEVLIIYGILVCLR